MLPLDETGSRLCVAWLKSRVKFGIWKNAALLITNQDAIHPAPYFVCYKDR